METSLREGTEFRKGFPSVTLCVSSVELCVTTKALSKNPSEENIAAKP